MTPTAFRRLAAGGTLLWAGPAQAHSPVPGIEGFYVGLLHPFSTPAQAVLMIGLGLMVGGHAVGPVRWILGAFAACSLAGLALGLGIAELDAVMYAVAVGACAAAALVPGRLAPAAVVLAAAGGLLIGEASIPDDGPARDRAFTMSGSMVGANVGLLYLYGVIHVARERFPQPWVAIAFQVAAAWLGAIALVMLALGHAAPPPA